MSQNHPYRGSRTGYRSQDDFYEDGGSHYAGQRNAFQRPEELSPTQSYQQPPSRATDTHVTMRPDVLNILDSCGLEPSDLSLLAELPEELITVETLPHLLNKLRDSKKKGTASASHFIASAPPDPAPAPAFERQRLSNATDYRPDRSSRPSTANSRNLQETWQDDRDLDHRHTTVPAHHSRQGGASVYTVEYGHSGHDNLRHRDHSTGYRSEPRQSRVSASSRHDVDYRHKPVVDDGEPTYLRKKDVHHTLPTKKEASDFHGKTPYVFPYACQLCNIVVLSNKDWNQHVNTAQHADSQLKLLQRYPEWDCHIKSVRRDEERPPARSTAHDHAKTARPQKRPSQSTEKPSNSKTKRPNLKKVPEKPKVVGKVISVKYSSKSIDEDYIRRLLGQFGAIIKIIMFPTLAFVEMGSSDQAGDIEKYFSSNPLEVEGTQVFFAVSEAFKFLKSSKVVSFSPLPTGDGLSSEIASIAERFGPVKNTLFLPSRGYVEMTNSADAEALVNHHTSEPLKLKGTVIKVDFSSEYETLKDCPADTDTKSKPADEKQSRRSHSPKTSVKSRSRSRSPRRTSRDRKDSKEKTHSSQSRNDSKDSTHSQSRKDSKERTRSASEHQRSSAAKEEKPKGKPHSSPVPEKVSERKEVEDSKSVEASEATVTHGTDSDSDLEGVAVIGEDDEMEGVEILDAVDSDADEVAEDDDDEQMTSKDGEQEMEDKDGEHKMEDEDEEHEMEKAVVQEETAGEVKDEPEEKDPSEDPEPVEVCEEAMESEALATSSGEEAQHTVEGPEQGETHSKSEESKEASAGEEEMEEETEEANEEENKEENENRSENTAQEGEDPSGDMGEVAQDMKDGSEEKEEGADEEEGFPEDLENLITLDEIDNEEDSSDENDVKKRTSSGSDQRVICLRCLPLRPFYTDEEFWSIGKPYGEVARYFLIRNRREGFIEMENADDAKRAVSDLTRKKFEFHGYRLEVALSWKYRKLVNAHVPKPKKRHEHQSSRNGESKERSRSRSNSKSKSQSKQTPSESKDKTPSESKDRTPSESKDPDKKHRKDSEASVEKSKEVSRKQEKSNPDKDPSQKSGERTKSPVNEAEPSVSTDQVGTNEDATVGETVKVTQEEDDALGQYKPNNPVGQEFVRPVVGYFCNLCNVIYSTEDEAKNEHCSSLSHFQKFKEHSEKKA